MAERDVVERLRAQLIEYKAFWWLVQKKGGLSIPAALPSVQGKKMARYDSENGLIHFSLADEGPPKAGGGDG